VRLITATSPSIYRPEPTSAAERYRDFGLRVIDRNPNRPNHRSETAVTELCLFAVLPVSYVFHPISCSATIKLPGWRQLEFPLDDN